MLLYNIFTNLTGGGHRNDVTDTRRDESQTRNRQAMKGKAECFYKENLIDRSFLVFDILRGDAAGGATQAKNTHC